MTTVIRTERLVLRRAGWDDLEPMHCVLSNPVATRYWSTLPHESLEQSREWMASMIEAPPQESDDFIVTADGALIGKLGCWRLPEIGFILDPAVWGCGYASEALAAYIAHRRAHGGTEMTADVDPANAASLRLLTSAGFQETGRAERTWEIGGKWHDSIYLRLEL